MWADSVLIKKLLRPHVIQQTLQLARALCFGFRVCVRSYLSCILSCKHTPLDRVSRCNGVRWYMNVDLVFQFRKSIWGLYVRRKWLRFVFANRRQCGGGKLVLLARLNPIQHSYFRSCLLLELQRLRLEQLQRVIIGLLSGLDELCIKQLLLFPIHWIFYSLKIMRQHSWLVVLFSSIRGLYKRRVILPHWYQVRCDKAAVHFILCLCGCLNFSQPRWKVGVLKVCFGHILTNRLF